MRDRLFTPDPERNSPSTGAASENVALGCNVACNIANASYRRKEAARRKVGYQTLVIACWLSTCGSMSPDTSRTERSVHRAGD